MKKYQTLFAVATILLLSSKQIFACDYYEDDYSVLDEMIHETGTYKLNVTGKVCSSDKEYIIPIKNGKIDGKVKALPLAYDIIGTLEVEFKNGKIDGLYKIYNKSGKLEEKTHYKNGIKEGFSFYTDYGGWVEENYKNGELDGLWKLYYESGALGMEGNFKNDIEEGLWKYYDKSGKLLAKKKI